MDTISRKDAVKAICKTLGYGPFSNVHRALAAINALPAVDEWRAGYKAGIKAAAKALKADAKLCDCAALEANECGCGAWDDYKSISSARAVEIVRKLADTP